jgi:hypothetical protein
MAMASKAADAAEQTTWLIAAERFSEAGFSVLLFSVPLKQPLSASCFSAAGSC